MERAEIKTLLETIEHQVSSSILGGMEDTYQELADLGYVILHDDSAHPSATITQKGLEFLENY